MLKKAINFLGVVSLIFLLISLLGFIFIDQNFFNLKDKFYSKFPNFELRKYVFKNRSVMQNFYNDYNEKFLPFTQFEKLNFKKKKILFENDLIKKSDNFDSSIAYKRYDSFFIDMYNDNLILTDYLGNFYFIKNEKVFSNNLDETFAKHIKSNLEITRVLDSYVYEDKLFVSYVVNKNNCNKINVSYAKINLEELNFNKFYHPDICNKTGSPGRMQFYEMDGVPGLLLSTSEGIHNKPGVNIQNKKSIFGKILFIRLDNNEEKIFSVGHRVIQGLFADKNKIISTEHGPRGGDEINLISYQKNYGWPIVSLGERYDFKYGSKELSYKKNHSEGSFQQPIFSFIPSIGISDIIKLPDSFSIFYENHFVISSLNGKSLFFTRFNENFSKVISIEKVFINKRIRDLKFSEKYNSIILALEETGELGILSNS